MSQEVPEWVATKRIIDPLDDFQNAFQARMLRRLRDQFERWQEEIIPSAPLEEYLRHERLRECARLLGNWQGTVPFLLGLMENFSRYGLLARALLTVLTSENPVPKHHECDAVLIQKDWSDWSVRNRISPMLIDIDRQFAP